jgi:hypothetical protein
MVHGKVEMGGNYALKGKFDPSISMVHGFASDVERFTQDLVHSKMGYTTGQKQKFGGIHGMVIAGDSRDSLPYLTC